MKIVVTGHGQFASGIESTVRLLAGQLPQFLFIDFLDGDSDQDLKNKFPNEDNLVFFCDLAGGTPYNQAVLHSRNFSNVSVIAGGNVGALLEIGLQLDLESFQDANTLAQLLIDASHSSIKKFEFANYQEEAESDGI